MYTVVRTKISQEKERKNLVYLSEGYVFRYLSIFAILIPQQTLDKILVVYLGEV